MRIGDKGQVLRACRLLGELAAVQRPTAEWGLCFSRLEIVGERPGLLVESPARKTVRLDLKWDCTREALRCQLAAQGLPASPEPPGHDACLWTPRPDASSLIKHAYVLRELALSADAFYNYDIGQSWRGTVLDIAYQETSTDLLVEVDGKPWRIRQKIRTSRPGSLTGVAYSLMDQITGLVEGTHPVPSEDVREGTVILYSGRA
ncbi:hypothetical protein ACH4F6_33980 [Streptomyces sp. NPDC017936]|uniref:hypothetical protein n=1 Tax=Streptomyces sp. NPDC017936 TaxID=3365016 RepID=UPI0037B39337